MMIHSMTATFGKLENSTLTLEPGMNVIQAPNEWGKSTWCAFLLAMFYGIDTKSRSGKSGLADKERYAPWSGSPMSGQITLTHNGRRITIERSTQGRIPMGYFKAYETDSGLEIPELNAANCGQVLLGVERSVFCRSGFIRLTDLPLNDDEALRSRLNALVTTGDESGDGLKLAKKLRELKNRCRYNRTGLLPQAEQELAGTESAIRELDELALQQERLKTRLEEKQELHDKLEQHLLYLACREAQRNAAYLEKAEKQKDIAAAQLTELTLQCAELPTQEETQDALSRVLSLREAVMEHRISDSGQNAPVPPAPPKPFHGLDRSEIPEQLERDTETLDMLNGPLWLILLLCGIAAMTGGFLVSLAALWVIAGPFWCLGIMLLVLAWIRKQGQDKGKAALTRKYGSASPELWNKLLEDYDAAWAAYEQADAEYLARQADNGMELETLTAELKGLCPNGTEPAIAELQQILQLYNELAAAEKEAARTAAQYDTLRQMVKPSPAVSIPESDLTLSEEAAKEQLNQTQSAITLFRSRMAQNRGRIEALGNSDTLKQKRDALKLRIEKLEQTYAAIDFAEQTLQQATAELQRRFAPQIAKKAQEYLQAMTNGRYDRIALRSDLSLQAAALGENTMHDLSWRSEGTIDQLYLALRLAVAEALAPETPLVLDDALVRFDDSRLEAALKLLDELSEHRQILLFSCQDREERILHA